MRVIFIKGHWIRRGFIACVCVLLSLTVLLSFNARTSLISAATRKLPIYCVEREEKVVALTFDAAWGADKTDSIAELIKEYEVQATYFVVSFWAEKHADKLRMLKQSGFEIGTHSNVHAHMSKLTTAQMRLDLSTSLDVIRQAADVQDIGIFRPPFGEYNDKLLTVAEELGLKTIQWDVDSLDWKDLSGVQIANRVLSRVDNGSIVLMHNDATHIVSGLRLILEGLKVRGYKCVTVSQLIYHENYKIDHTGRQISLSNGL